MLNVTSVVFWDMNVYKTYSETYRVIHETSTDPKRNAKKRDATKEMADREDGVHKSCYQTALPSSSTLSRTLHHAPN
jgi:hypothetical protein